MQIFNVAHPSFASKHRHKNSKALAFKNFSPYSSMFIVFTTKAKLYIKELVIQLETNIEVLKKESF